MWRGSLEASETAASIALSCQPKHMYTSSARAVEEIL